MARQVRPDNPFKPNPLRGSAQLGCWTSLSAPMHRPPESIATARLVLRRGKPADADAVYEYGSDPDVARYMDWRAHASAADATAILEDAARRWDSGEEYSWASTAKPDDRRIGSVSCRVRGHSVDLGYVLSRDYWGRGYATEATRAIVEWVRSLEGVYRLWATCDVENTASARVLERSGCRARASSGDGRFGRTFPRSRLAMISCTPGCVRPNTAMERRAVAESPRRWNLFGRRSARSGAEPSPRRAGGRRSATPSSM
jgi:RimJ/RimL family protein N-acetyltransferase